VLLHDAVRHAEPETRALADFLGREKRVENFPLALFSDSGTIVANLEHH
jgi:hypothetical protein